VTMAVRMPPTRTAADYFSRLWTAAARVHAPETLPGGRHT
jgi:hypothetical protein